jgi:hypothetical protein
MALAAGGLIALGGALPASAASTAHPTTHAAGAAAHHGARQTAAVKPDVSSNAWYDLGNHEYLSYDSSTDVFLTVGEASEATLIGTATDCNGAGDCEHTLPNGKCLEWESGPNTVSEGTCSGIDRQLWFLVGYGGGYVWENDYATTYFNQKNYCLTTPENAPPFLTASSTAVYMKCGLASGYNPDDSQIWS